MARSSRRFGEKMPGVSTRMICDRSSITMPRISARVVCTLRETIVTLEPTSATKPQRVGSPGASPPPRASLIAAAGDAFAFDHHACRDLFGRALTAANAFGRSKSGQIDGDAELRIVVRPGALD